MDKTGSVALMIIRLLLAITIRKPKKNTFLRDPGKHMTYLLPHTEMMGREMEKGDRRLGILLLLGSKFRTKVSGAHSLMVNLRHSEKI